ncbi:Pol polyprotein [Plakobranchus ocellatus]|uniref:Pol polyprotein n=1 Tax=Plakobranchus ocellatus TaxID=259542 RepID=A0AAV4BDU7_9GAST|nr:Pol polyprotein [Plakobranchus ocellatus]
MGTPRLVLPTLWTRPVFNKIHGLSHSGVSLTQKAISLRVACMRRDIRQWCKACPDSPPKLRWSGCSNYLSQMLLFLWRRMAHCLFAWFLCLARRWMPTRVRVRILLGHVVIFSHLLSCLVLSCLVCC